MAATRHDVATATRWQIARVVDTLHQSFLDDPFLSWVFPDPTQRDNQIRELWLRAVQRRSESSRVWQACDAGGAALWHAPAKGRSFTDPSFEGWFHALVDDDSLAPERFRLFAALAEPRPVDTHWYLATVGVRPDLQGKGVGTSLLTPMLTWCRDEGFDVYLESTNPRNVVFYERLGFSQVGELVLPDGSSHITQMERLATQPDR